MGLTSLGEATVCTDCIVLLANGERPTEPTEYEPLSKLADVEVTPGGNCDVSVLHWQEDSEGHSEGCERIDFTWTPCEGCGSPLAGERHLVTLWEAS